MARLRYFHISHGLRGAYMPDGDPWMCAVKTRRELKSMIQAEVDLAGGERTVGFSRKAIAQFAALCWREANKPRPAYLPHCLPCHERGMIAQWSYGVFVSVGERADWIEHRAACDGQG